MRGSICALVTPFSKNGVDYATLGDLIQRQADAGSYGIVPCGTTGESPTLSHTEHEEIIAFSVKRAKPLGLKVLAGTGSNSTAEAIRTTTFAKECGSDGALIVTPYYNKPNEAGLKKHFAALSEIDFPLCLYNVPGRCGVNLRPRFIMELCRSFPQIKGVKVANGNLEEISETIHLLRNNNLDVAVLSGDDALTLPILSVGGVGVISVIANVMPEQVSALLRLWDERRITDAQDLSIKLFPLSKALLDVAPNPIPIKSLLKHLGFKIGECRLPLALLEETAMAELFKIYEETQ
jgi:4-hydroxy-tetrahydrodipicolinate synthase